MTIISTSIVYTLAQYHKSTLKIPAPAQTVAPKETNDNKAQKNNRYSTATPTSTPATTYNGANFPIKQAAPQSYEELLTPAETPIVILFIRKNKWCHYFSVSNHCSHHI